MFDVKEFIDAQPIKFTGFIATCEAKSDTPHVVPLSFLKLADNKLYIMTDCDFVHSREIRTNKKVSVAALNGLQFIGDAEIMGNATKFPELSKVFSIEYESSWKKYGGLPNQVFINVVVQECRLWRYLDGIAYKASYDYVLNKQECNVYQFA